MFTSTYNDLEYIEYLEALSNDYYDMSADQDDLDEMTEVELDDEFITLLQTPKPSRLSQYLQTHKEVKRLERELQNRQVIPLYS